MMLLDCYLPVFKQVLTMTGNPTQFDEYDNSRHTCITELERAVDLAEEQDACDEEKALAHTAVIAWIDEMLLRSSLPWRLRWQSEPLQRKYLNISVAGERFFTLLAQLDPAFEQARIVFLFCLQQGFRGQYTTADDEVALQDVIDGQRQLCLPESWQTWPNDATITPDMFHTTSTMLIRRRPLLSLSAAVLLLYGTLYLFLHHYMF